MSIPVKMALEWLAHENAQLNRQVTDLQARGTELVEENRRLRSSCPDWNAGPPESFVEGMVVEFQQLLLLVGHINALGGVCDDCVEIKLAAVERWKWVWELTTEEMERLRASCEDAPEPV